jgi:hypothetical protein
MNEWKVGSGDGVSLSMGSPLGNMAGGGGGPFTGGSGGQKKTKVVGRGVWGGGSRGRGGPGWGRGGGGGGLLYRGL